MRAISSARSSIRRAVRSRIAARSCAGSGLCIARSAAATAVRASSAPPFATRADDRVVVRRAHLEPLARLDPLAVDQEPALGRCRRHAGSVVVGKRRSGRPFYALGDDCRRVPRRRRSLADRAAERLALRHPSRRAGCAGAERPRRPRRRRSRRDRGRADGLRDAGRRAGAERRPRCRSRRGLAGVGLRDDGRPAVRLVASGGVQRRLRRAGRSPRSRRRRGRRAHDARSDGLEPRRRRVGRGQREDRRALADRPAGHLGRGDRRGVGAHPGGARRVLAGVAPARGGGDRRGEVRERDRARSRSARVAPSSSSRSTRHRDETRRSTSSRRCSPPSRPTAS